MLQIRRSVLTTLMLLAAGCGSTPTATAPPRAATLDLPPSAPIRVGTDTVTVLGSGRATFDQLARVIGSAQRSIHLEMYEFGRPDLAAAVVEARSRGVAVTAILDTGVPMTSATATVLRAAGIDVLDYPTHRGMIDHVKLLVADSAVAVVGGINWGPSSHRNHDFDAVVRGPAVLNLERQFARDLLTCGRATTVPDAVPDSAILVAATQPSPDIHPLALRLVDDARDTLDLEQFVITDPGVVHALEAARRRGVRIRLLLDPGQRPSDGPATRLRAAGIEVRLYRGRGELLHAKAGVADGVTVLFGSANWTAGGFQRNHEIDIEIVGSAAVAGAFERHIDADWTAGEAS